MTLLTSLTETSHISPRDCRSAHVRRQSVRAYSAHGVVISSPVDEYPALMSSPVYGYRALISSPSNEHPATDNSPVNEYLDISERMTCLV